MEVVFNAGSMQIPGSKPFTLKGRMPLLLPNRNPDVQLDSVLVKRISHDVASWFVEQKLVKQGYKVAYKYAEQNFVPATYFTVPDLKNWPPEKARLIAIFIMWTYVVDDFFDEDTSSGSQVGLNVCSRAQLDKFLSVLPDLWYGKKTTEEVSDLEQKLQIIGKSVERMGRETALVTPNLNKKSTYFLKGINDFFDHLVYYGDTNSTIITSVSTYTYTRYHLSAFEMYHEYQMIIEDIQIPRSIRRHRFHKRIVRAITDVVSMSNDLLSLKKELYREEPLNLVWMKVLNGCTSEEACEQVMREIIDLTLELRKHGDLILAEFPDVQNVQEFIRLIFQWQDGHWQFYSKMPRYMGVVVEYRKLDGKVDAGQCDLED